MLVGTQMNLKNIRSFSTTKYQDHKGKTQNNVLQKPFAITKPAIHDAVKINPTIARIISPSL
jgi:hypothetical protein